MAGTPGRCPDKNALFCQFSIVSNRRSPGHRPVDPCLSRWVPETPGRCPGISLKFMCSFLPEKIIRKTIRNHSAAEIARFFASPAAKKKLAASDFRG